MTRGFFERWAGYEPGAGAREGDEGPERAQLDLLRREVTEMENDILRRLLWAGLMAAAGALATVVANRIAAAIWVPGVRGGPAGVSAPEAPPPRCRRSARTRSLGELVFDVSERTSTLIREEIELAKTEVREKIQKLLQGSVVGIAAGVFVLMALAMFMHGIAWLLNHLFFSGDVYAGFLIEAPSG